jgi:hypothetical protein
LDGYKFYEVDFKILEKYLTSKGLIDAETKDFIENDSEESDSEESEDPLDH